MLVYEGIWGALKRLSHALFFKGRYEVRKNLRQALNARDLGVA